MKTATLPSFAAMPMDARSARVRLPLAFLGAAVAGSALPAMALPTTARAAQTSVSLALDWYPNSNHAGIFLAEAQGLYQRAGVVPKIYTPADPTTVLQTVGAGRDDFGISYQAEVLLARAQGVPVVSVAAVIQQPLLVMMALRSSGITRPRDFRGKSVGISGLASDDALLSTVLGADGLTLDDVRIVNVGYDLVPALITGKVDVVTGTYWNHETLIAEREGYPVNVIKVEEWGVPSYYELVLVASEETVANRADVVRTLVDTIGLGYAAAKVDPNAALEALKGASQDLDVSLESEALPMTLPLCFDAAGQWGVQDGQRWADYAGWMAAKGLIPADLDPARAWFQGVSEVLPATPDATPALATPLA